MDNLEAPQRRIPRPVKLLIAGSAALAVFAGCQRIDIQDADQYRYEQDIALDFNPPFIGKQVFIDNHPIDSSEKIPIGNVRSCEEVAATTTEDDDSVDEEADSVGFNDFYDLSTREKVTFAVETMNCNEAFNQEPFCPSVPMLVLEAVAPERTDTADVVSESLPIDDIIDEVVPELSEREIKAICFDYSQAVALESDAIVVPLLTRTYEAGDTVDPGELVTNCQAMRLQASDAAMGSLSQILAGERTLPSRQFMESIDNIEVSVHFDTSFVIQAYCDEIREQIDAQDTEALEDTAPVATVAVPTEE